MNDFATPEMSGRSSGRQASKPHRAWMRRLIQWSLLQGPFAACAAGLLFGSGENTNGKTLPPGVPRFHGVGTSGGGFHTLGLTDPDPPKLVTPPNSKTVKERDLAWLAVEATGSDLQFQWLRNGQEIPGATGFVYLLGPAHLDQAGDYTVRIGNSAGSLVGGPVSLAVTPNPYSGSVVLKTYVPNAQDSVPLETRIGIVSVAAGGPYDAALTASGGLYAWSINGPVAIPDAWRTNIAAMCASDLGVFAVNGTGQAVQLPFTTPLPMTFSKTLLESRRVPPMCLVSPGRGSWSRHPVASRSLRCLRLRNPG